MSQACRQPRGLEELLRGSFFVVMASHIPSSWAAKASQVATLSHPIHQPQGRACRMGRGCATCIAF